MQPKQKQNDKRRGEKSPKRKVRVEDKAENQESFAVGDIVTTIFENRDKHGQPYYRFVQDRKYVWSGETLYAQSFRPSDSEDVARGAAEAFRRIQKRQRSLG
jgi:hypothetical protein